MKATIINVVEYLAGGERAANIEPLESAAEVKKYWKLAQDIKDEPNMDVIARNLFGLCNWDVEKSDRDDETSIRKRKSSNDLSEMPNKRHSW